MKMSTKIIYSVGGVVFLAVLALLLMYFSHRMDKSLIRSKNAMIQKRVDAEKENKCISTLKKLNTAALSSDASAPIAVLEAKANVYSPCVYIKGKNGKGEVYIKCVEHEAKIFKSGKIQR